MFALPLPRTLAGALLLATATATQAATLLVTVKTDAYDGVCNLHCSLRDAVAVANQSGAANTILLPSGTYKLTRPAELNDLGGPIDDDDNQIGDLDVVGELRIRGSGATKTIIQGQFNDRLIEVRPGARLVVEKLTLEGGNTAYTGGALENHGQLRLSEILVQDNKAAVVSPTAAGAPAQAKGGAIANYGDLSVIASRLQRNVADGLSSDEVREPRGGAVFNLGSMLVRDSHFFRNGLRDGLEEGLGGAIFNAGYATIERSTFAMNEGLEFSLNVITNMGGELTLTNVTMTGNHGALSNMRNVDPTGLKTKATLTNVTIAANEGGHPAVYNWRSDLLVRNSIIAGNTSHSEQGNCHSEGLDSTYQAMGLLTNDEPSSCTAEIYVPFLDTFPKVLRLPITKLDDNHWFFELPSGSPAIDAGIGDCIDHDQRGVARPQDGNEDGVAVCDLGAYELSAR